MAGVFILDESLIPYNFNNEFYQITDQRIGIHINQEIMIRERYVRVLKIIACNDTWLNKYYYNPIKNIYNYSNKLGIIFFEIMNKIYQKFLMTPVRKRHQLLR